MKVKAIQKGKKNSRNEILIYIKIANINTIAYVSSGIALPAKSLSKKGLILKGKNIPEYQIALDGLLHDVQALAIQHRDKTAQEIAQIFKNSRKKERHDALDLLRQYMRERDGELSINRMKIYNTLLKNHLPEYKNEIEISKVNAEWIKDFEVFLSSRMQPVSAEKYIIAFNTFLRWCAGKGIDVSPVKTPKHEGGKELIFLTEEELKKLHTLKLPASLNASREMFLFSCYTGLRYSDVHDFDLSQVHGDFIQVTQIKTKTRVTIPLNKWAKDILERNNNVLPKVENPIANKELKLIGELLGLNYEEKKIRYEGKIRIVELKPKWQLLTFHCGRATYIMYQLMKGVSPQAVMQTSGHSDWRSFQRYVRFTPVQIKEIHDRIW
jgi:integrase